MGTNTHVFPAQALNRIAAPPAEDETGNPDLEVFFKMFEIVKREEMAGGTVILNEIAAPLIARKAKPGQFVIIKANEEGERIPLTMADTDPDKGTITIIYMVVGKSTALFKTLNVGDGYQDVIGPLGKATHLEKQGTVVCVGGGTGIAVLHPITRALKEIGNRVIGIIGARNRDLLILEDKMRSASNELHVCTDDGSYGRPGFVTEALKEILEKEDVRQVVAIGPVPMMKFVSGITAEYNVPTLVSLNPIMVDGTGMCGGCRVTVGGETRFACVDGPEFDGHKVDYDELMKRLQAYSEDERRCYNDFCRMEQ
ncbi:NfnA: NADH-dependent ferredoxin:NADP+ oxidoreductase, subunit alpha [Desulfococcus multivorans]|nr:NfnA: NADH-dependent ferredoxin:NADP+ oxidoreductase, subunit alpha [Desulfococcus multivorans]CAJ13758.1 oxidoreductase, NAD-binding [Desulfococcus multivorans]